jgi:hypothetical protein
MEALQASALPLGYATGESECYTQMMASGQGIFNAS